jgi:MFS family permease
VSSENIERKEKKSYAYAWGVTVCLSLGYALSFLDRELLSLVIEPVKQSFELTDFQVSLLMGPAFAIFYTVMGIPLGWAADRYSRTRLIAIGMSLWSVMTAFCGLSANFLQIFIARIGIGVGEAALTPSAVSLLSDYFPKTKLPFALSIYSIGMFIGAGMAGVGGGYVLTLLRDVTWTVPIFGTLVFWQIGFLIAASPGVLLALIILFIREPKRKEMATDHKGNDQKASFPMAFKYMWERKKMFLCLFVGGSMVAILQYQSLWYPEHFMRSWDWTRAQAGQATGLPTIFGGISGLLLGGYYMSSQAKKGVKDIALKLAFISAIGIAIPAVLMPLMSDTALAIGGVTIIKFFVAMPLIAGTTAIRMAVPNQMRGQFTAMYFVFVGLIGANLGPVMPGFINTYIFGEAAGTLGYALAISAALTIPFSTILLWISWGEYKKHVYKDD